MQDERKLEIKSFPLAQYWGRGVFAVCVTIIVIIITYNISGGILLPIFAFLVISLPQVNFIFPATYVFYEKTFSKTQLLQTKRYEYRDFKLLSERVDGIQLYKQNGRAFDFIYIFDQAKREAAHIVLQKKICPENYNDDEETR
jgi:hypothetical protein